MANLYFIEIPPVKVQTSATIFTLIKNFTVNPVLALNIDT